MDEKIDNVNYRTLWGEDTFIQVGRSALQGVNLPEETIIFLHEVGLPKEYYWFSHTPLEQGLQPLATLEDLSFLREVYFIPSPHETDLGNQMPSAAERLARLWVLGTDIGTPSTLQRILRWHYCVEEEIGQVFRVSFSRDPSSVAEFINSSIPQYAAFLLMLHMYFKPGNHNLLKKPVESDCQTREEYHQRTYTYYVQMGQQIIREWSRYDSAAIEVLQSDEASIWRGMFHEVRGLLT